MKAKYNLPKKVNVNDIKYLKNYSTITKFLKKVVKYSNLLNRQLNQENHIKKKQDVVNVF